MVILSHPAELKNGNSIQQSAISVALGQLSCADYCGVLNYTPQGTQSTSWMWKDEKGNGLLMLRDRRADFNKALAASRPGDFAAYDEALQMAFDALKNSPVQNRHMLVLTDGDPTLQDESVLGRFAEAGISISVVHADLHGEPYYRIPRLMAKKTGGHYWVLNATAPSSSFEGLFRDTTQSIKSLETPKSEKQPGGQRLQKQPATSSWPNKNVESWAGDNGNSLTTVSINSRSICTTVQGWITADRRHVVVPSHFVEDDDEIEVEVWTVDGKIYEASVVESQGHLSLLSLDELAFSGLPLSDRVTVQENELLYINSRFGMTPVRVIHPAKTITWSMIPGTRFADAIAVDTGDMHDVDLLHGAAVVNRSGKLAGMIMNVPGREKPVVPLSHIQALSSQLIASANNMKLAAEEGTWTLEDGVTLRIDSRKDKLFGTVYRASLTWKETEDGRPALSYSVDIAGNEHVKWAVAWEKGKSMIWLLAKGNHQSGSSIRSIDYSVPVNIVTSVGYGDSQCDLRLPELTERQKRRRRPFSIRSRWVLPPKQMDVNLVRHFELGDARSGISSLVPHIPGSQYTESAILQNGWTFEGRIEDSNGKPMRGVRLYAGMAGSYSHKVWTTTTTDDEGNYKLVIRPDLLRFVYQRHISIYAAQQGVPLFRPHPAKFRLRLSDTEVPQRLLESVRLDLHKKRSRLPGSGSLPGGIAVEESTTPIATLNQPNRADFKDTGQKDSR